jgi:type I restriction enzyme M protein
VDNNFVETIISIAPNLFYGTSIAVTLLVLSKHKTDTKTQFIDASGEDFFKKATNNNVLTDDHIATIMDMFDKKEDVEHVAVLIDNTKIAENDYNLSVSSYVVAKDNRVKINIAELNEEVSITVEKINSLRADIDLIIKEISSPFSINITAFLYISDASFLVLKAPKFTFFPL